MEAYKFKIGNIVCAKQKTFNKQTWESFLRTSKDGKGKVIAISKFRNEITIKLKNDNEFIFYPEDLDIVSCETCKHYISDCSLPSTRCISWSRWEIKEEREKKDMKYKMLRTINAEHLCKDAPCISAFNKYLEQFGYLNIRELDFDKFIKLAESIDGGIDFLLKHKYIDVVEVKVKEKTYTLGDKFILDNNEVYILARPHQDKAVLISFRDGNRWNDVIDVNWINGKISESEFNKVLLSNTYATRVNVTYSWTTISEQK